MVLVNGLIIEFRELRSGLFESGSPNARAQETYHEGVSAKKELPIGAVDRGWEDWNPRPSGQSTLILTA